MTTKQKVNSEEAYKKIKRISEIKEQERQLQSERWQLEKDLGIY